MLPRCYGHSTDVMAMTGIVVLPPEEARVARKHALAHFNQVVGPADPEITVWIKKGINLNDKLIFLVMYKFISSIEFRYVPKLESTQE